MHNLFTWIETGPFYVPWLVLAASFFALSKGSDLFVNSAVTIAGCLRIPKLVIGIVLVSFATTAPEMSVSLFASLHGRPEMALGNAVGSVICNVGVALALCGALSLRPVPIIPRVLLHTGGFLALVSILAFAMVWRDNTLDRLEGAILLALFAGYLAMTYRDHRSGRLRSHVEQDVGEKLGAMPLHRAFLLFAVGLGVVILASRFTIVSAVAIATALRIPESIIAMTLVALGTSVPEVATSIAAARKGQGELSVGNILGANIMNICWVAGMSAVAHPLVLQRREIFFMFPAMMVMLGATFWVLKTHASLSRREGMTLFALYIAYLGSFFLFSATG